MKDHWAKQYIGLPHRRGAAGPDAFDCWHFVVHVQEKHYGVYMSAVDATAYAVNIRDAARLIAEHEERSHWAVVPNPMDGDIALMSRAQVPAHVGIFLPANNTQGILHCVEGAGVVYTPLSALRMQGWGGVTYVRRKGQR